MVYEVVHVPLAQHICWCVVIYLKLLIWRHAWNNMFLCAAQEARGTSRKDNRVLCTWCICITLPVIPRRAGFCLCAT